MRLGRSRLLCARFLQRLECFATRATVRLEGISIHALGAGVSVVIVVVDNYDSFVFNIVQALGSLGEEITVFAHPEGIWPAVWEGDVGSR